MKTFNLNNHQTTIIKFNNKMTSFLRKIFGRINKTTSINESSLEAVSEKFDTVEDSLTNKTNEDGIVPNSPRIKLELTVTKIESLKEKPYNIASINKQSTKIKNEEGFLSAINFLKSFIEYNTIDLHDLISLLKRLITYMIKEKSLSNSHILEYVNSQFGKHPDINDIENYTRIADILERIDVSYALEYLESKLNQVETENILNLQHFDSLILLSDYYSQSRLADKAFQTARRAGLLVTNYNEKNMFLQRQLILAEQNAKICFEGKNIPMYSDYLHYQTVAFILKQCTNLLNFQFVRNFYRGKEEAELISTRFSDSEKITSSFDNLNIVQNRDSLLQEIYDFTFKQIPILMEFPQEYLSPEFEFPKSHGNYSEFFKIIKEQEEYAKKEFLQLSNIHEFSSRVINKYYKLENVN